MESSISLLLWLLYIALLVGSLPLMVVSLRWGWLCALVVWCGAAELVLIALIFLSEFQVHGFGLAWLVCAVLTLLGSSALTVVVIRALVQRWRGSAPPGAALCPRLIAASYGWLVCAVDLLLAWALIQAD